ncbi:hypothetical protein MKW94_001305 [Papaver nudicaule]|uniref:Uncharacterized protein n=1 Tax=Papaver nudicaule TaxID=74823 RepID=A0AA41VWB3_PAPNU|nr:hypothetical protein [Papaver nudicaule]
MNLTGDYIDFEGWEDGTQPLSLDGNEESQVVPFPALSENEETHFLSSENLDFKEFFLRHKGFGSREELLTWCMDVGKVHNFVVVCKSAKIKDLGGSAQGSWLQLCCERSGKNISHQAKSQ